MCCSDLGWPALPRACTSILFFCKCLFSFVCGSSADRRLRGLYSFWNSAISSKKTVLLQIRLHKVGQYCGITCLNFTFWDTDYFLILTRLLIGLHIEWNKNLHSLWCPKVSSNLWTSCRASVVLPFWRRFFKMAPKVRQARLCVALTKLGSVLNIDMRNI